MRSGGLLFQKVSVTTFAGGVIPSGINGGGIEDIEVVKVHEAAVEFIDVDIFSVSLDCTLLIIEQSDASSNLTRSSFPGVITIESFELGTFFLLNLRMFLARKSGLLGAVF